MPSTARRWHPIQAVNAYAIRLVWLRDHREGTWLTVPWRLLSSTATPFREPVALSMTRSSVSRVVRRHCPCWMSMASGGSSVYRRAEEIFEEENTRLLANPLASSDDIENLDGWTLHRLLHSALTHDAKDGTSTPMLPARSRQAFVRSLERYARLGVDSVARHVAERDPAARRRT